MMNFLARRFSNNPINGDFSASISVAGTLWIWKNVKKKEKNLSTKESSKEKRGSLTTEATYKGKWQNTFPLLKT